MVIASTCFSARVLGGIFDLIFVMNGRPRSARVYYVVTSSRPCTFRGTDMRKTSSGRLLLINCPPIWGPAEFP